MSVINSHGAATYDAKALPSLGLSKEDVHSILCCIDAAKNQPCNEEYAKKAEELRDYYKGEQLKNANPNAHEDFVVVNRLLPNIEIKSDTIAFRTPDFILKPRTLESKERVKLAKALLEYYWETSNTQEEAKKAWADMKIIRLCVIRVGWNYQTRDISLQDDRRMTISDSQSGDLEQELEQVSSEGALDYIPDEEVIVDQPQAWRINPADFFIDPNCDWQTEKARFIVWRERTILKDVLDNPSYENTEKLAGKKYSEDLERRVKATGSGKRDSEYEIEVPEELYPINLLHYYEKARRLHIVFTEDEFDEPLLAQEWPWPFNEYPFVVETAHPINDVSPKECPGDVDLAKPLQDSLNITRTRQLTHISQASAKYQSKKGVVDPHARRQLESSVPFTLVEHNGMDIQSIGLLQTPTLNPEIYRLEDSALRDIDYQLGVSDFQRNVIPQGRRTATEVSAIQSTGSSRVDRDLRSFESLCARVARLFLALIQKYASHAVTLEVYDPSNGASQLVEMSNEQIKGRFDVSVEVSSTMPLNKEVESQRAVQLLQVLTPYAQMPDPMTGQPVVNLVPLLKKIIELSGISNAAEIVQPPQMPPQDPMAAMMQGGGGDPMAQGQDPMAMLSELMGGGMPQEAPEVQMPPEMM